MLITVTPDIRLQAPSLELISAHTRFKGGVEELCAVGFAQRGGVLERCAGAVALHGSLVERCAIDIYVSGSLVETFTTIKRPPGDPGGEPPTTESTFDGLVMNTATLGVGRYTSFPMRSLFTVLEDNVPVLYGISAEGLHKFLPEQDDNGEAVTGWFVSGLSDLGTDQLKWVTDAYIELRCEGQFMLEITYDEKQTFTCVVDKDAGVQGLHFKRIKLPRGIDGNHIQIKVSNQNGADFDLQTVRVISVPKTRRIRGA